jgi:hypothetical protein
MLSDEERIKLIDQLNQSYIQMPDWVKTATKHAMTTPTRSPVTGEEFTTFRDILNIAEDFTLEILRDDFESNGDLVPSVS